ncbi:MAG: hypothetical protein F6J86_41500 [Symploca sp. SIO1B1]|nr:hypothetical protein [Symploca sp. SIO1B1]
MSISIATKQAFTALSESGDISQETLEEVKQKISYLEDDEDIADAIGDWLQSQNEQIRQAYQDKFNQLCAASSPELSDTSGIGNSQSQTDPGEPNPTSQEQITNIIVKKKLLNKDSSAQSKPNS